MPQSRADEHVSIGAEVVTQNTQHTHVAIYVGPDPGHRTYVGSLMVRPCERHELLRRLADDETARLGHNPRPCDFCGNPATYRVTYSSLVTDADLIGALTCHRHVIGQDCATRARAETILLDGERR